MGTESNRGKLGRKPWRAASPPRSRRWIFRSSEHLGSELYPCYGPGRIPRLDRLLVSSLNFELALTVIRLQNIMVGYTGGHTENPTYKEVCSGTTGHAEALLIEYKPDLVKYEDLVRFFFRFHDPTTPNRQGNGWFLIN